MSKGKSSATTPFGVTAKFWLLRHYWWLLGFLLFSAVGIGLVRQSDLATMAPFIAAILSTLYFLQKQKLEELKTFIEIFESCNKRYDRLNADLEKICRESDGALSESELRTLSDYFNLCAEEYLYFSKGYVYPEVWKAWYNGMFFYLENSRIQGFWADECSTNSHYGLSFGGLNK